MQPKKAPLARDIMTKKPVTLDPQTSLYEASKILVKNRWLSAPVVKPDGTFMGVFSQQCCMRDRVAEIRHAPPDHEAAERSRQHRDADPRQGGTDHEIVQQPAHAASP